MELNKPPNTLVTTEPPLETIALMPCLTPDFNPDVIHLAAFDLILPHKEVRKELFCVIPVAILSPIIPIADSWLVKIELFLFSQYK